MSWNLSQAAIACAGLFLIGSASSGEAISAQSAQDQRVLRVCADPNNLPFSNRQEQGFENKIAEIVAEELNAELDYTWWAQRRGFIRNTLDAQECDVVIGVPSSFELVLATRSYYRSSYVFVYRADSGFEIESFDDPTLKEVSIGVHLIGDDGNNAPPAHALGRRQIVDNVVGYSIYGDYREDDPPARVIEDVANGEIDLAIVWGPLAGYFAPRFQADLVVKPVSPPIDIPALPFIYSISMGVRLEHRDLKAELDDVIHRRRDDIESILDAYDVPRL